MSNEEKQTNRPQKHRNIILCISGIILIIIGVGISCCWYFWLLPMAQRYDPLWHDQFTKKAYWDYIQNYIHRYGWTHDDFEPVGNYGDKNWAKWIMDKAAAGAELDDCGNVGHKDSALRYITNQDPVSSKKTNCEKAWLEWWAQNKNKSQLEWIQKGFESYNVKVSMAPSKKEQEALLILLGNTRKNKDKIHDMIPNYVKYNAFRWLRDSGFNPVDYAIKNVNKSTSKDVIKGLYEYQKLYEIYPKGDYVGIIPFSDNERDNYDDYPRPNYSKLGVKIIIYCIMILPIVLGIFSLVWSIRKKKEIK